MTETFVSVCMCLCVGRFAYLSGDKMLPQELHISDSSDNVGTLAGPNEETCFFFVCFFLDLKTARA